MTDDRDALIATALKGRTCEKKPEVGFECRDFYRIPAMWCSRCVAMELANILARIPMSEEGR